MRELKIGQVSLWNPLILAPMAGISDLPFRLLCREQGCAMTVTEMISAKALWYGSAKTETLMAVHEDEHPVSVQLFGSDAYIISEMAKKVEELDIDIIDINMGCPVPKVVNNGEGSALMRNPKLAAEIVEKTAAAIRKPLTVKIRKGFREDECNGVELAYILQESGASAVAVHGRTREQYYSGRADWDIIRAIKEKLSIPVIANGDVFTADDALNIMEYTHCDGVMVARGAKGNPWIFAEILEYIEAGQRMPRPTPGMIAGAIRRHAAMEIELKGEYIGIREMRKHVGWYTAGCPNGTSFRRRVNEVQTYEELDELCGEFEQKAPFA